MKKPSLKSLRAKLDKTFSAYIRRRDADEHGMGQCITCGRRHKLEASHFIPRQHAATRWDERNVHGQCSYENRWLHGNLAVYYLALVKKLGQPTVDELMRLKRTTVKYSRETLEEMIERYRA